MKRRRRMELILAGAMLTLSACQATPTEDVIVQKAERQEMLDAGGGDLAGYGRKEPEGTLSDSGQHQLRCILRGWNAGL